jgi:hypothetical protein
VNITRRTHDLHEQVETKLSQVKGILTLICGAGDEAISEAALAAEDLIEGVEKALGELLAAKEGNHERRYGWDRGNL